MDNEERTRHRGSLVTTVVWKLIVVVVTTMVAWLVQQLTQNASEGGSRRSQVDALVSRPEGKRLDDVGGHEEIKQELRMSVVLPMRRPDLFYDTPSLRPPRGVLLHGPPGTGKTMLAHATASEAGVSLITLHNAALESKWWGESPKLLEAIFREAHTSLAPCIIFIDEIDGMGRARNETDQSCVYSFKCELLRNMDNVVGHPVVVIACTNCPNSLDPALSRRFQRRLHVGPPSETDRKSILATLSRDDNVSSATLWDEVARRTSGCTGSDLSSMYEAASNVRMQSVNLEDLEDATSSQALIDRIGPLTMEHVEAGARRVSRPLAEEPRGEDSRKGEEVQRKK